MVAKVIPLTRLPYFFLKGDGKRGISFFDYKIPQELEEKIKFGQIVRISFRHKRIFGLVAGVKKTTKEKKIKLIEKIVFEEGLMTEKQFKIVKWLSDYYLVSFSTLLKVMLPSIFTANRQKDKLIKIELKNEELSLKIPKRFLPYLQKNVSRVIDSRRKKFLLLWHNPREKIAFYYAVIKKILERKQKILILVPEIEQILFLLPYLAKLSEQIVFIHSRQKKSEVFNAWQKILNQQVEIVIGTRMTVFAPIKNLGLIILEDEENDLHKSEQYPYYDTRIMSWKITKTEKTKLIFASSTPRVDTYYHTFFQDKFFPLDLRYSQKQKQKITFIDMREEIKMGNFLPLSDSLKEAILKTLTAEKKVLLFLKRKGFATFNFCADCGFVFSCPRCKISLITHKKEQNTFFLCHHCHYQEAMPLKCPQCRGVNIKMKGIAIQKIEEILNKIFPDFQTVMIEKETKRIKMKNEPEIILTTLPFYKNWSEKWSKNFGLVGVINADVLLHRPDFRAFEKTFQELTGIVNWTAYWKILCLIQSWSEENQVIKSVINNQGDNFYQEELIVRKDFAYPPLTRFFKLTLQEKNKEKLNKISLQFEKRAQEIKNPSIKIFSIDSLPRRKKFFITDFMIRTKNLHPLSPIPDEVVKIIPPNSFLNPQ